MSAVIARLRPYAPVIGLTLVAAALSWWSSHAVFPSFSWNRDEPVYLWQMETLRAGRFATPDGGFPEFFHPWLSAARDGTLFSQYTLGWPVVLLIGDVLFGTAAAGLAIGAMLAVSGTYAAARALWDDHGLALCSAAVMTASPVIVVQGGVYLGYLFTLGVGLWFSAALVSGMRDGRRARLLAAGVLLGVVLVTRPFDAVLWALAIGGPIVVARRRDWRSLPPAAAWVAVGALPFVVVTLWYNQRMTGSATTFPVTVKDPLDTYGFGIRRIAPQFGEVDYGIVTAVKGTLKNGFYLLLFVFGGIVGLPVALVGLWRRRRDRAVPILAALLVAFPAGYFFFWGTNVSALTSRISAPIYFVPMYAPLCMLIAVVLVETARRRRSAGVALAVVLLGAGLPFGINRIETNQRISRAQEPWLAADRQVRSLDHESLVFVADSGPYLMFFNPYSANEPDLDGPVLWSTDRAGENLDLIDAYPDRTPYRMQASFRGDELGPDEHPKTPDIALLPLERVGGEALRVRAAIQNPTDAPVVVATMLIDGEVVHRTLATDSARGARHELTWTIGPNASDDEDGSGLTLDNGTYTLAVGFGPSERQAAAAPVVRHVLPYRVVDGRVEVLLPARAERLSDIGGPKLRWRPTTELPEVALSVEPT